MIISKKKSFLGFDCQIFRKLSNLSSIKVFPSKCKYVKSVSLFVVCVLHLDNQRRLCEFSKWHRARSLFLLVKSVLFGNLKMIVMVSRKKRQQQKTSRIWRKYFEDSYSIEITYSTITDLNLWADISNVLRKICLMTHIYYASSARFNLETKNH